MLTAKDIVARDVIWNVSHLIPALAKLGMVSEGISNDRELRDLADQALAACYGPVDEDGETYRDVLQHFIVTDWLADMLEAEGEKVVRDVAGLTIWGRTTYGQSIALDGVIKTIARKAARR